MRTGKNRPNGASRQDQGQTDVRTAEGRNWAKRRMWVSPKHDSWIKRDHQKELGAGARAVGEDFKRVARGPGVVPIADFEGLG